jgi:hypothetical protein
MLSVAVTVIILSVARLRAIVISKRVNMLNVIRLNVVRRDVVAPQNSFHPMKLFQFVSN